jgi:type VI secretion system protein ImpL
MKKILKVVLNRWTMVVLGLLAVSLLIWLVGPVISIADHYPLESATVRLILIVLVVFGYIAKPLWGVVKAKQLNTRLMDSLLRHDAAPPQGGGAGAEEVAVLRRRFEEALATMKQALSAGQGGKKWTFPGFGRRQYVYELPWYIFIGAPGSGKTTALINSGLQFPLAERFGQEEIRGIGGTRNCDWSFTNEAVLIDTAGRYTTQDSNLEIDRAAWSGFLQLLKKFRPRRPINGAIVTVSVSDLLLQNAAQREAQANAIRKRIQELHDELKIRFPIYVMVTKADLLAGFMEFFAEYSREERAQVWGMTFALNEQNDGAAVLADFASQFSNLESRLNDRLVDRMQQERNPQVRGLLYTFPDQFHSIRQPLSDFLNAVFSPTRFEQAPMLRGVYFISGTQEGSPIDRVMGGLARALHLERKLLPPGKPSGKSFFLTRLIRDVIIAEANLAGTNLRWERRSALLQLGTVAGVALMTVFALGAWTISYSRNKSYVAAVDSRANATEKELQKLTVTGNTDVVSLLPVLNSVRDLADVSQAMGNETPWSMGFGLSQTDKLGAASDDAYQRLLQNTMLPRLALQVEQQLRGGGAGNPELLYEELKAYIMLADSKHFDAAELRAFISAYWQVSLPSSVTPEQRRELEGHLDKLLSRGEVTSPLKVDASLIAEVRSTLVQTPIAQRIYNRLKRQGLGEDLPEFTVADKVGASAALVFRRASGQPLTKGVPGLFTYDGYYKDFDKASAEVAKKMIDEESWVLGVREGDKGRNAAEQARASVIDQVRRLYLQDYVRIWDAFINDIKIVSPGSLQQSIDLARLLSAQDSPLPLLLRAIVHEVTLVKIDEADKTVVDKASDKFQAAAAKIGNLFGESPQASTVSRLSRPESIVDDHFDNLRRLVKAPAPGQPAPIDASLAIINQLYTQLIATQVALNNAAAPPQSDIDDKVRAEAGRSPEPLRSMLLALTAGGNASAMELTRRNLTKALVANVGDFCEKALVGRYPFDRTSKRDMTQDDFARLFAPGGLMDDFFKKNLAQYVDTSSIPWSFHKTGDVNFSGANDTLEQFRRARVIRDVFFMNGGRIPSMRLMFTPTDMDTSIMQFNLDVDGQLVKYSHGPQVPTHVQWPGPRGGAQVRLQLSPTSAGGSSGQVFDGPWALFHLFDKAQISPSSQPEKFGVTFNVGGRKAYFDVVSGSVQNPFRLRELRQFSCPEHL